MKIKEKICHVGYVSKRYKTINKKSKFSNGECLLLYGWTLPIPFQPRYLLRLDTGRGTVCMPYPVASVLLLLKVQVAVFPQVLAHRFRYSKEVSGSYSSASSIPRVHHPRRQGSWGCNPEAGRLYQSRCGAVWWGPGLGVNLLTSMWVGTRQDLGGMTGLLAVCVDRLRPLHGKRDGLVPYILACHRK